VIFDCFSRADPDANAEFAQFHLHRELGAGVTEGKIVWLPLSRCSRDSTVVFIRDKNGDFGQWNVVGVSAAVMPGEQIRRFDGSSIRRAGSGARIWRWLCGLWPNWDRTGGDRDHAPEIHGDA
jgi:hypothetical protein